MWLLTVLLISDPVGSFVVPLTPTESVTVTTMGTGAPVVMIPGLFGSGYAYRNVMPLLAEAGYRALVIEPLGVGGSTRPRRADYSLTAQADRMAAVLDTLGVRHAVVMGHAVSASIALRLALRRPDLVAGVIALDGGLAEAAATEGFRKAMAFAPLMRLFGGKGLIRKKIHKYMIAASANTSWVTPAAVEGYTADAARNLGATLDALEGIGEAREPQALIPALGAIRCPVRLVAGAESHQGAVPPEEIALMRARLPVFAIDSLPRVGHFAFEEDPGAIVQVVRSVWVWRALALPAGRVPTFP
jgi:pimeloyl-ACP methyl ester carboxylesterase